jgi:hypothetical protein
MIYFLALIPATALTIAGYLALYLSNRSSEGAFRNFGKYLGFWAFTLAGLVILGAIFAAAHGGRDGAMIGNRGMHGCMHGPWPHDPRFFGPGDEVGRDVGRPEEPQPGAAPRIPGGPPNPTAPPGSAAPPAR